MPAIRWASLCIDSAIQLLDDGHRSNNNNRLSVYIECAVSYDPDDWTWQENPDSLPAFCEVEIVGRNEAYKGNFDLWDNTELEKWRRLSEVIRTTTSIDRLDIKMSNWPMTERQAQNSVACIHVLYEGILYSNAIDDVRIE